MDFPDLIREGLAARQRGDHAAACQHFMQACQLQPRSAGAWCELAFTHRQANEDTQARRAYEQALEIEPEVIPGLCGLGVLARKAGQVDEAIALLQRAHERDPTHAGAAAELALTLRQACRWQQAEALYAQLAQTRPESALGPLGLAQTSLARDDARAALDHAIEACRREPARSDALLLTAALRRELGQYDEAQATLDPLLAAVHPPATVWMEQGLLWRARGDSARAQHAFTQAQAELPERATLELAHEATAMGEPERARNLLADLAQRQPGSSSAQAALATLHLTGGELDACLSTSAIVLSREPLHPGALRAHIQALIQGGQHPQAQRSMADCADVLDAGTTVQNAPALRSILLEACRTLGDKTLAHRILQHSPEGEVPFPLWYERVLTPLTLGQLDLAEAELARARPFARRFEQSRRAYLRGLLADANWQVDEAISHLSEALRLHPTDAGANAHLARLHLMQGRVDLAHHHHQNAQRLNRSALQLRGQSERWSHSLQGQLINEYRLAPEACDTIARAYAGPESARGDILGRLVRKHPEHTAPALAYLLWLRQSGQLDAQAANETAKVRGEGMLIPKQIVQFWHEPKPPEDVLNLCRTWSEHHPGWRYVRFDQQSATDYLQEHYGKEVTQAFRQARHPAQAADLFRYAFLAREGGVWADADDRCDGALTKLPIAGARMVGYQEPYASIGNNFIACVAKAPLMKNVLKAAVQSAKRVDGESIWLATGPGLVSRVAMANAIKAGKKLPILTRAEEIINFHATVRYKLSGNSWLRVVRTTE